MKKILLLATLYCASIPSSSIGPPALANRVALVLANSVYKDPRFPQLQDVPEDAVHISDALKQLGFSVFRGGPVMDATQAQMKSAIKDFVAAIPENAMVFVYFGGHGVEQSNTNYLMASDSRVLRNGQISRALDLEEDFLGSLAGHKTLAAIFVVDACRQIALANAGPIGKPGKTPANSYVAFSTSPHRTAQSPSPYTKALINHLGEAGVRIEDIFNEARKDVLKVTGDTQRPMEYGALPPEIIYLRPPKQLITSIVQVDDQLQVVVNGVVALDSANDLGHEKPIVLKPGNNTIEIRVFNQKTFTGGIAALGGHQPEGWSYSIKLKDPEGEELILSDGEDRPQEDGPRHGKWFTCATAVARVDPANGLISFHDVRRHFWSEPH